MYEAIMIAATGLTNQQRRLDTIADNMANTNTVGFKTARLDFKDALYTAGMTPGPAYTADGNLQKGHGVVVASITGEFTGGSLQSTENMLDLAIESDSFFEVADSNGRRLYTRAGNFCTAVSDDGGLYLVNSQGYFVQSGSDSPITVPEGTTNIDVSSEGLMTFYAGKEVLDTAQLGIYTFANKTGLSGTGGTNYEPTVASGGRIASEDPRVRQGVLESSNVSMADEMTRLLRTQRAFSLASRALTTADDMEGIANNMRR